MGTAVEEHPVTDHSSLFRREALEHRARQRGPGDVVRVAPGWTTGAFYLLLLLFAAAVVAGVLVEIDRYAMGPTALDGQGRVLVLLPAALAPHVPRGRPVELGGRTARVVSSTETVLEPSEVEARYRVEVTAPSVAVLTSAEGSTGDAVARVLVEREPVLVSLIPGLDALLGNEDG